MRSRNRDKYTEHFFHFTFAPKFFGGVHFGGCKVLIGVHFRRHAPQNAFFPLLSREKTYLHFWSRLLQEELRYQTILQKGPGKALVESSAGEHMHRHARNQASAARPPIRLHLSDEEERAHSNASTPTKEMRGIEGIRSKLAWPLTGEEFTIAKASGTSLQRQHVPVLDGE